MKEQVWLETMQTFFTRPDELVFAEETARGALERFNAALQKVLATYPHETLGIVSHGTVISLLVAHYNAIDAFGFWQRLELPCAFVISDEFKLLKHLTVAHRAS
jgi:broad specificity phosphatase PhoE